MSGPVLLWLLLKGWLFSYIVTLNFLGKQQFGYFSGYVGALLSVDTTRQRGQGRGSAVRDAPILPVGAGRCQKHSAIKIISRLS